MGMLPIDSFFDFFMFKRVRQVVMDGQNVDILDQTLFLSRLELIVFLHLLLIICTVNYSISLFALIIILALIN
jgi:hypothetical protein